VVYEMATGKKAFEGKTSASVMAKILEVDPPSISSLQPMTPPQLDRVVKKCLRKDRDDRWQSARDVTDELKWIAEGGSQVGLAPSAASKGVRFLGRRAVILGLAALLVVAAVVSFATWNLKPSSLPQPVTRTVITLPPGQQLASTMALSPDGTDLAYVAIQSGTQQLYLRAMDSLDAKPISGAEGATEPFFSPDGQWLGFFAGGKLKKVSVSGGATISLNGAELIHAGASWGSQGTIIFGSATEPLKQVSDSGGAPQSLTRFEKGETSHRWPEFLPGGKAVLFAAGNGANWSRASIAVQSVLTGERRNLVQGAMYPYYAPSGHLVYVQGGTLMAVPFDPQRLRTTGAAVPMVEGVLQSATSGAARYSISATGSLV
jgi:hypothetical protein